MCGIFAYTGSREAAPILIAGLRRLEYRGYDSAGLATVSGSALHLRKRVGRIDCLAGQVAKQPAPGFCGIAHTRWATHGGVADANAHPHVSGDNLVAVVHNGVIENYATLKDQLEGAGVVFRSQTDTEVIAHLIAHYYQGDLVESVLQAQRRLVGTYGLAVVSAEHPGLIVGARLGSPVLLGVGREEKFLASDPTPLAGHTDQIVYLNDHQLCVLTPDHWEILDRQRTHINSCVQKIDWAPGAAEKGDFPHYMLKEIYEQPEAMENALRGRLDDTECMAKFGGLNLDPYHLRRIERVVITACGTSYHAALIGKHLFEDLARIPVEVEYASEFRYSNSPLGRNTLVVVITQSGETADTLAAMREAKRKGNVTLALCNVVGSTIAREADGGIYLHAGPEIGVASTKAFTSQVSVLTLLALELGRMRHLSSLQGAQIIQELRALPDQVRETLKCREEVRRIAQKFCRASNFLYMGRQYLYPVALEGALKLKEISYIHAEGYPAGEMKHGPIALVDPNTPSVFLLPRCATYDKVMSNLEEVKARSGPIIAVASPEDERIAAKADEVIRVPDVPDYLQPLVVVVPLQLLAYEIAALRGCDIDKPRNLAKSVTVE